MSAAEGDVPEPAARVYYFWDFFGPSAEGTAAHFLVHLDEFLVRESIEGCTTGLCDEGPGHHAAYCAAPPTAGAVLERALKPRRKSLEGPRLEPELEPECPG